MNSLSHKILPQTTSTSLKSSEDNEESKSDIQSELVTTLQKRVNDFENKSLAMVNRLDETKELIAQCTEGER